MTFENYGQPFGLSDEQIGTTFDAMRAQTPDAFDITEHLMQRISWLERRVAALEAKSPSAEEA